MDGVGHNKTNTLPWVIDIVTGKFVRTVSIDGTCSNVTFAELTHKNKYFIIALNKSGERINAPLGKSGG